MDFIKFKHILDCTHTLTNGIPVYPGDQPFKKEDQAVYELDGYYTQHIQMSCGIGTHMDAPSHFIKGGRTITDIDTSELLIPVVVIDVSEDVLKDSDYTLTTNSILNWEEIHGPIPENSFVIMKTGWSSRYQDASLYLNFDEDNTMHFPGFSKEAAELLIHHRTIVGIGIDTASTDPGLSSTFDVHKVVLGASKFQIENLNLHQPIPSVGAFGIVLPLKLDQAPEAPVRILILFND